MDTRALLIVANTAGGELLPDNGQWMNRIQIRSASSNKLYIVAQRKSDMSFACSCFGWVRYRRCKHLDVMVPLLERAAREALLGPK